MSNIKKAFEKGKAFIAFITCGDPDLETTARAVRAAAENGADLIELGIQFSFVVKIVKQQGFTDTCSIGNFTCRALLIRVL